MARPSHSEHVLQQLNNQREWGFLCDCCITIGDTYFRAHKAVLAACSSYFRMLFIRDQQATARLDLSNMQISAECFDLILQLMYLGRIMVGHYEFEELKASMAYLQMCFCIGANLSTKVLLHGLLAKGAVCVLINCMPHLYCKSPLI